MDLRRPRHLPYAGSLGSAGVRRVSHSAPASSAPDASSPVAVLPLELMQAIVRLLPQDPRFLFGLLLLSRAWYEAVLPFIWSSMPLGKLLPSPTWKTTIAMHAAFITDLDTRSGASDALRSSRSHTISEEMYKSIDWLFRRSGVRLPRLRSLTVARVTRRGHIGVLHQIAVTNPHIYSLTIDLCGRIRPLTNASRPPSHPPLLSQLQTLQLTSLRIYSKLEDTISVSPLYFLFRHIAFTKTALLDVVRQAPQLQELVVVLGLGSRADESDATFLPSLVDAMPNLRILKLGFPVPPLEEAGEDESLVIPHEALRLLAVGDSMFDDDPSHKPATESYFDLLLTAFPNLEVYKFGLFLHRGIWNIQESEKPTRLPNYLTKAEVFDW